MDEIIETLNLGHINFMGRFTDYYDEKLHDHSFFEIVFVITGQIKHKVNDIVYDMKAGDAFIIAPGVTHRFIRKDNCSHRDVMFSRPLFKAMCDFIDESLYQKLDKLSFFQFKMSTTQMDVFENSYATFSSIENIKMRKNYEKVLSCLLIGTLYISMEKELVITNSFKSKCSALVDEHYSKSNALELIRKELGYTNVYFCKKFKSAFSVTPTEYINVQRIKNAGNILSLSECSIAECCYAVGFESLPYFIKLFKEYYQMKPVQFRKLHQINTQKTY